MTAGEAPRVYRTSHSVDVAAPAERVYELVADVSGWAQIFPPTVHGRVIERTGNRELIQLWAIANDTAKTWTSWREHDPAKRAVSFRQERSQAPVGGMGGSWIVDQISTSQCRVRLLHDFFAASDDPTDIAWIQRAVDHNSEAELGALKARAELTDPDELFTFADTVEVDGRAIDVYDFLNEAGLWVQHLPHVQRVELQESTPGLQVLEMDTRAPDGSIHTTCSVRVCESPSSIRYKQHVLPALLTLHTGQWSISEESGTAVSLTSQHTVRINTERVNEVLGSDADVADAASFVRRALSANSMSTLTAAKAHAETLKSPRAAS